MTLSRRCAGLSPGYADPLEPISTTLCPYTSAASSSHGIDTSSGFGSKHFATNVDMEATNRKPVTPVPRTPLTT